MKKMFHGAALFLLLALLNLQLTTVYAQGTAFTYQGQLNSGGNPATGSYDLAFTLYTTNVTGSAIAGPVTNTAVGVTNGLFTTTVDFGNAYAGTSNWLEIAVSTNAANTFTTLAPRQQLTPVPYAIYSANAGSAATATTATSASSIAATNISGTIPLAELPAAVITNDAANLTLGGTNVVAPLTVPPSAPVRVGSVGTGSAPYSVAVAGRYAYVVNNGSNTLQVFDVSTPSAPVSVGSVGTGSGPTSVAVAGRYAYVVNYDASTLQVFDVSTPSAPVSVGSVGTGVNPNSVAVAGRYAYVVNNDASTLQVFDVSTPSAPVSVGSVSTGSGPYSVAVAGRYAYVVNAGASTLQVFDVSTPSAPVSVGSVGTGSGPTSVAVAGRYAYVVSFEDSTLQIFDVSTNSAPVSVGSVGTGSVPFCVAVAGRYAYVVNDGASTLQIFDVSTPSAPVSVGSVDTGVNPYCVAVAGRYAYVVNYGADTLQAFNLGGAYIQQFEAGAVETGTLQTRDTVTVGNNLNVRGGLTVSASARITGGLSVDNGTITATNFAGTFTGNGSGLTSLSASALPSAVVTNHETGVTLSGTFSGNGSGLTSLSASALPSTVLTNNETGVTLSGTFSGNGSGLTGLSASALPSSVVTNNETGVTLNGAFSGSTLTLNNGPYLAMNVQGSSSGGITSEIGLIQNNYTGSGESAPALRVIGNGNTSNGALSVSSQGTGLIAQFGNASAFVSSLDTNGTWTATAFNTTSDKNVKENFTPVDAQAVLAKVAALPISRWNFTNSPAVPHVGPMAQDFYHAFNVGADDRHIATVDEDGVALAAIQGLNQKLEEENAELKKQNESLDKRLDELEQAVQSLAAKK